MYNKYTKETSLKYTNKKTGVYKAQMLQCRHTVSVCVSANWTHEQHCRQKLRKSQPHGTATLCDDLHWLLIRQRIVYKICTIVYKCVHGTAPSYLTELSTPVAASTGCRHLRSAAHSNLLVPRSRTITYGPRSFAVSGSCVWNDLPSTVCITRHTQTVSGRIKDNAVLFSLRDVIWRVRDCLGRYSSAL